jgi:hypothetical protein
MIPKFTEWMKVKESTAFTRARKQAALGPGLGPSIPDAAINSHDTPPAWVGEKIHKRNKKKKHKECD